MKHSVMINFVAVMSCLRTLTSLQALKVNSSYTPYWTARAFRTAIPHFEALTNLQLLALVDLWHGVGDDGAKALMPLPSKLPSLEVLVVSRDAYEVVSSASKAFCVFLEDGCWDLSAGIEKCPRYCKWESCL